MPRLTKSQAIQLNLPSTTLQTIEIPVSWSQQKAVGWLVHHGFNNNGYRTTRNYHRYWQTGDIQGAKYFSKKLPDGVVMVWQQY